MPFNDLLSILVASASIIIAAAAILLSRYERKEHANILDVKGETERSKLDVPLKFEGGVSVSSNLVEEARNKLRILEIEREILSYAIRRLYEAQAEGRISEEERDRLAQKYKEDMKRINEEISRGQSIIALNELERMRDDLLKLFNQRFNELNRRIEELRIKSGIMNAVKPKIVKRAKAPEEREVHEETERKKPRQKKVKEKKKAEDKDVESEAEKKVEQIMAEIEKVLDRLQQIEASD